MYLKTNFRNAKDSTDALADRMAEIRRGGEKWFDDADLRPVDEQWWVDTLNGIGEAIRSEAKAQATPDAELVAQMPGNLLKDPYGHSLDLARLRKAQDAYIQRARFGKPWVMYVAYLVRDAERLLHEAVLMGDRVIKARSRIYAFAGAVAMETGCATLEKTQDEIAEEDAWRK